jgi:hypothetical protein
MLNCLKLSLELQKYKLTINKIGLIVLIKKSVLISARIRILIFIRKKN